MIINSIETGSSAKAQPANTEPLFNFINAVISIVDDVVKGYPLFKITNHTIQIKNLAENILKFMFLPPDKGIHVFQPNQKSLTGSPEIQQNCKCLVVDDSIQCAKLLVYILSSAGIYCDVAVNGEIALEFLEKNEYEFIIMDLQMPVMDGITTMQHIRHRKDEKKDITVIAATAISGDEVYNKCIDAGFNGFLKKPFQPEELLNKINLAPRLSTLEIQQYFIEKKPLIGSIPDLFYLESISFGDKVFIIEMVESAILDIDKKLGDLHQHLMQRDKPGVGESVHSLKSLIYIVGLKNLTRQFNDIDRNIIKSSSIISSAEFENIMKEWETGKSCLLQIVEDMK